MRHQAVAGAVVAAAASGGPGGSCMPTLLQLKQWKAHAQFTVRALLLHVEAQHRALHSARPLRRSGLDTAGLLASGFGSRRRIDAGDHRRAVGAARTRRRTTTGRTREPAGEARHGGSPLPTPQDPSEKLDESRDGSGGATTATLQHADDQSIGWLACRRGASPQPTWSKSTRRRSPRPAP